MPTILCIDDYRTGLATRKAMLENQGYSVLTAEDGPTGLALLRTRHDINAVVLDYKMAGMDGEAVANFIRKERPDVPIIALSGSPFLSPELAALADAVVKKGEHPQVLLAALERLTGTKPETPPAKFSSAVAEARRLRKQAKAIRSEARSLREHQKRQAS